MQNVSSLLMLSQITWDKGLNTAKYVHLLHETCNICLAPF